MCNLIQRDNILSNWTITILLALDLFVVNVIIYFYFLICKNHMSVWIYKNPKRI